MRISNNITMLINPAKVKGTLANVIDNGMNMAGAVMVGYIKDTFSRTGGTPARPGTPPAVQTGTLRRAIQKTPSVRGVVYVHTSSVKYAPLLEYGGTLKPTTKKYLAVPIGREGRRIRRDAKDTLYNSDRNLFVIKSKKGNLLLMERHGKRQKATPRFVLKRSVFIKARPFMRPALANRTVQRDMARAFAMRIMRDVRRLVEA